MGTSSTFSRFASSRCACVVKRSAARFVRVDTGYFYNGFGALSSIQLFIGVGGVAARLVGKNALARRAGLLYLGGIGDGIFEDADATAVSLVNDVQRVARQIRAHVGEGDENALHTQAGVDFRLNERHSVGQLLSRGATRFW